MNTSEDSPRIFISTIPFGEVDKSPVKLLEESGIDYKINEKKGYIENEKLSLSIGQVFNHKENIDMPSKRS